MKTQTDFNQFWLNQHVSAQLADDFLVDETQIIKRLLQNYPFDSKTEKARELSQYLIQYTRKHHKGFGLEAFLQEYPLNSTEGAILMSIAEALLRIPDEETGLQLIREQFAQGDWSEHLHSPQTWLVNLSTWSVLMSREFLNLTQPWQPNHTSTVKGLGGLARFGEHTLISAVNQAISVLGKQFVLAEEISTAIEKCRSFHQQGYSMTLDMLGEAALTQSESRDYFKKYVQAIERIGDSSHSDGSLPKAAVSVKLSALHPRFECQQSELCLSALFPALKQLCILAKINGVSLVIDAEESERLELTLSLFAKLMAEPQLKQWEQLGIAVQSYQKRAPALIDILVDLAKKNHKRIIIRLVKGAYWDYEIKQAQQKGWQDFPVFTHKMNTELCYLYCADKLLQASEWVYPQFASHNAQTISSIYYKAQNMRCHNYEFQQLYGMGDTIYQGFYHWISDYDQLKVPCSIYAPVGRQRSLLPYLVRRLIENGANNSFVNQMYNQQISSESLWIDLKQHFTNRSSYRHPRIATAEKIYPERNNSTGLNLNASKILKSLASYLAKFQHSSFQAQPLVAFAAEFKNRIEVFNPATLDSIGKCYLADARVCQRSIEYAQQASMPWKKTSPVQRAELLLKVSDLIEQHQEQLLWLLINEAGKVLQDAHNEIRETVDFCRYYAQQSQRILTNGESLKGYTGEENTWSLEGRGIFLCISPWNFPLAIFTGQIAAALVTGNCVVAKPASHTPLIAFHMVQLFYQAGLAREVLQLLPSSVEVIRDSVLNHPKLSGVAFTGSHPAAHQIQQVLSQREGAIIPLIAETGGINAMLADSSALSEQLVRDMMVSAFGSAGQRCSALRVAFIQEDIYERTWQQLLGAMQELVINNPNDFSTDIGPLISPSEVVKVLAHIENMRQQGRRMVSTGKIDDGQEGEQRKNYVHPTLIELESLEQLQEEVFGPVLHLIPFKVSEIEAVVAAINRSGFGLTFGIHTRIPSRMRYLSQHINAGNIYINRNMVGAVVGVQPFGGRGLSGTGPKAGGPLYLPRFCHEKSISFNTMSLGGNISIINS